MKVKAFEGTSTDYKEQLTIKSTHLTIFAVGMAGFAIGRLTEHS